MPTQTVYEISFVYMQNYRYTLQKSYCGKNLLSCCGALYVYRDAKASRALLKCCISIFIRH